MHKYITIAVNYLEERDYEVTNKKENTFLFKVEDKLYIYYLDDNFPYSLPRIITSNKLEEYPHFIKGKNISNLCIGYEEDFNLYETTPEILITEVFESFFRLLSLSLEAQKKEFFKEFLHFWHRDAQMNGNFKLYIKPNINAQEIFIEETFIEKKKKKKIARTKLRLAYTYGNFINDSHFKS
ncbi:MAG: hypothetical protein WBG30_12540, partial [Psychrilyobacter sp.]|uniref:hypothetical protein n=1 Tax=Psychrilyobacter sp. TaxID=2586924 RepID=UPI003C76A20D